MRKGILILFVMLLSLTGCDQSSPGVKKGREFAKFLQDEDEKVLLPSGTDIWIMNVGVETNKEDRRTKGFTSYGNNNIVVVSFDKQFGIYETFIENMSIDELKADLKYLGDQYIEFSKKNKWSDDYYLLINAGLSPFSLVYDYEKDIIYIPNDIDIYKEMFKKFSSVSYYEVEEMENGPEWLVRNGFATKEDEELKIILKDYYRVHISSKGVFSEYHKDTATPY